LKPETSLKIRAATAVDIPAMVALERQAATAAHWSLQQYEDAFSTSPRRSILAIENSATIQGFLVARATAGEWEIENVVVVADARRRGLASELLGTLLDHVRREKAEAIFLEVRESNLAAHALYEKFGFAETGRRKNYYRDPVEDAIVYRLPLT
jgi:[ribosomal protein S18]-alanine N-acetyltransferase